MALRRINHPDVEINEVDRTQIAPLPAGSTTLILGYSDSGKSYNPVSPTSIQDIRNTLGVPTNDAERYMYYGCKEVIDNGGNLVAIRLPYNNLMEKHYKTISLKISDDLTCNGIDDWTSSTDDRYKSFGNALVPLAGTIDYTLPIQVGAPSLMTNAEYNTMIETGDSYSYDEQSHFTIVMDKKDTLGGVDETSGIFIAFFDFVDGVIKQRVTDAANTTVLDSVKGIALPDGSASYDLGVEVNDIWSAQTIDGVLEDSYDLFSEKLSDELRSSSVSESLAALFPGISYSEDGETIETDLSKFVGVAVCKTTPNANDEGKLNVQVIESFIGSVDPTSRDNVTAQSTYLPDSVNGFSKYIRIYGNGPELKILNDQVLTDKVAVFAPYNYPALLNFNATESAKRIQGDKITGAMEIALEKVENIDELDIDLILDAGLSTISEFTDVYDVDNTPVDEQGILFEDEGLTEALVLSATNKPDSWRAVISMFRDFAQSTRRDCLAILDTPRHMELIGATKRIKLSDPEKTFSNVISPQLRYIAGINSSYTALYSNWQKIRDGISGTNIWLPPTIKAAGVHLYTEFTANYWDAPAGYNRGILSDVLDVAYQPNKRNMDDLYTKSINYVQFDRSAGFVQEGQKTTQIKPSAFDRINVRKLFNRLERVTYKALKFFKYEPNNVFTRREVVSVLDPVFADAKIRGGIFDYQIICDESNNTPDVIDRNELRITVLIKPTRTAEFIVATFVGVRTGDDFGQFV
jgi:hypothetical protein